MLIRKAPFANSYAGISLDLVAKRYGVLPSDLAMIDRDTSQAILFNIAIASAGRLEEAKASGQVKETTAEKIRRKRRGWGI